MKVVCIDSSNRTENFAERLLKEGNVYTAHQCACFIDCYQITEVPYDTLDGVFVSFKKDRFIPLSERDETELVNECFKIESE